MNGRKIHSASEEYQARYHNILSSRTVDFRWTVYQKLRSENTLDVEYDFIWRSLTRLWVLWVITGIIPILIPESILPRHAILNFPDWWKYLHYNTDRYRTRYYNMIIIYETLWNHLKVNHKVYTHVDQMKNF